MAEPRSVTPDARFTRRSATFIGSFTLAGRIVERVGAFGQIVVVASVYGSSFIADRYFIASIVPLMIGAIAGESLSANILPALIRKREYGADHLLAAGFWLATLVLIGVTGVYLAVATVVVRQAAPAGSNDLGVWFAFAPIAVLLGLSGYLSGALTYFERYVWPPFRSAIATVCGLTLTLIVVSRTHDLVWVAVAVTGGYALSFVALLVETHRVAGFRSNPPRAAFAEAYALRRKLGTPVVGGLLGGQVFVLIERALASTLGVGAVATLSYARGVVFTPIIIAQAIALGLYPSMVRSYEADNLELVRRSLERGLRITLFLGLAMAAFFATYGQATITVLLERGALEAKAVSEIGAILAAFSLALLGNMLMVFMARVFYAIDYFRAIVWAQFCALVVYVGIAFPFRAVWQTEGLALAFGIAETIGGVYAVVLAARRIRLSGRRLLAGAVAPAVTRAALVVFALVAFRAAIASGFVPGSSSIIRVVGALGIGAVVGGAVLWHAPWPELAGLKSGVRRPKRS